VTLGELRTSCILSNELEDDQSKKKLVITLTVLPGFFPVPEFSH